MSAILSWLRSFLPAPVTAGRRERLLGCLGAGLGLLGTEWLSRQAFGVANPWFIAPMGASAVLLFAMPVGPVNAVSRERVADQKGHAQGAKRSRGRAPAMFRNAAHGLFGRNPKGTG